MIKFHHLLLNLLAIIRANFELGVFVVQSFVVFGQNSLNFPKLIRFYCITILA